MNKTIQSENPKTNKISPRFNFCKCPFKITHENRLKVSLLFLAFILILNIITAYILNGRQLSLGFQTNKGITKADQAYFELRPNKTTVSQNDLIDFSISLAANPNQKFNAAVAVVEWDPNVFEFVSASGKLAGQFTSSFIGGNQGKRVLLHFAPSGDPAMANSTNMPVDFATLKLKAKVNNPKTTVKLSSILGDLALHYVDKDKTINAIDQSLASNAEVIFR
jgi:hypothetical protein